MGLPHTCCHARAPPRRPRQYGWSAQAQPLASALAERLRGRMLDLVGRAYGSISPAKLGALLGCSEAEAAAGELRAGVAGARRTLPGMACGMAWPAGGACAGAPPSMLLCFVRQHLE